jgi:hypothetical protein
MNIKGTRSRPGVINPGLWRGSRSSDSDGRSPHIAGSGQAAEAGAGAAAQPQQQLSSAQAAQPAAQLSLSSSSWAVSLTALNGLRVGEGRLYGRG